MKIIKFIDYKGESGYITDLLYSRRGVVYCNECVKFEFNDISLYMKNDFERRQSVSLIT
jgi:hypothetical protein